jgi:hypothetical protein
VAGLGRGRKITAAKKAPEAIEKAALLLEEKGWCTGQLHKVTPARDGLKDRYCAEGALEAVADGDAFWTALGHLDVAAGDLGEFYSVTSYNDAQTDKRKVIRFMRRVAKQMRGTQ